MYQGFFRYGGIEFANAQRATLQSRAFDCPVTWLLDDGCENLYRAVNGGIQYDAQTIQQAPWYDENVPESGRFLGVYPVSVDGLDGSTRTGNVVEGILDGGDVSGLRKASRRVRMRLELVAAGDDALDYGMAWLSSVLDPDRCGVHGTRCGVADLQWLSTCPPDSELVRDTTPSYWEEQATNLALNGGFEYGSTTVEVYRNLLRNGGFSIGMANWMSTNSATLSYDTAFKATGSASLRVETPGTANLEGAYHAPFSATGLVVGDSIAATVRVHAPAGASMRAELTSLGTGGASKTELFTGTGDWQTVMLLGAASGSSLNPYVIVRTQTAQAITFWVDAATVVKSPAAPPIFDGAVSPDPDLTPSWTGAADNSESILTGIQPAEILPTSGDRSVQSTRWSASGSKSLRQISNSLVNAAGYVNLAHYLNDKGLQRGVTYTAGIKFWQPAAGATTSGARRIAFVSTAAGFTNIITEAENIAGEQRLTITFTVPTGTDNWYLRLYNGGKAGDPDVWWDDLIITEGDSVVPFFDGDTADTPDGQRYEWTGTPGNSTSTWESYYEEGYTPWEIAATNVAYRNPRMHSNIGWAANVGLSRTAGPEGTECETTATFAGNQTLIYHQSEVPIPEGSTFTSSFEFTLHDDSPAPVTFTLSNRLYVGGSDSTYVPYTLQPGESVTATSAPMLNPVGSGWTGTRAVLRSGSAAWPAGTRFTVRNSVVSLTEVPPPFFDGDTPDNETERYRWLGAPNNSPSVREVRSEIKREETNEEYAERIRGLTRVLHDVAAISGPTVVERHARPAQGAHGAYGNLVEVVFASETPFIYSLPRQLDIGAVSTQVVQDIPYNLAKYPSAELASTSDVLVATNYSTNPSAEANATGWTRSFVAPITSAMVSAAAQSSDIAASGTYSAKVTFTPSGSGTGGTFSNYQQVALTGGVGARYSINVWAAALGAGQAKIASMDLRVSWRNGSTALRTDVLGTFDPDGQVISVRSIEPPPTADNANVEARVIMGSWTTGDIVNLYVDALSVSVP